MDNGVLYIALEKDFLDELGISVRSVKDSNPDLDIAVVTRSDLAEDVPEVVDEVVSVDESSGTFLDKVNYILETPFEKTLYLDTDTYVDGNLDEVFELLDHYDLASCLAPHRQGDDAEQDIPESFPMHNTGVIAFRKSKEIESLFDEWRIETDNLESKRDQQSFRKVLYCSDVSRTTMPSEYNYRFIYPGYADEKVKIFHGRLKNIETSGADKEIDYRDAVEKINSYEGKRVSFVENREVKLMDDNPSLTTKILRTLRERL